MGIMRLAAGVYHRPAYTSMRRPVAPALLRLLSTTCIRDGGASTEASREQGAPGPSASTRPHFLDLADAINRIFLRLAAGLSMGPGLPPVRCASAGAERPKCGAPQMRSAPMDGRWQVGGARISGDEVHRDMLRRYVRCAASGTGAWYVVPERGGGHAAGDRPLACTRPHEWSSAATRAL
jgi:hypothetical protein